MQVLFQHESTRFIGKADRDVVSAAYLELRGKLDRYDEECALPLVRMADDVMTGRFDAPLLQLIFCGVLMFPWTWAILAVF